jgi:hypothetical protein
VRKAEIKLMDSRFFSQASGSGEPIVRHERPPSAERSAQRSAIGAEVTPIAAPDHCSNTNARVSRDWRSRARSHGTNDAQKTMGVISLALIAHGDISAAHFYVPFWVKLGCALAIALGTASGGWRIINTMGNRLTDIESPQGFAAESSSAAVILASSYYGIRCQRRRLSPVASPARDSP